VTFVASLLALGLAAPPVTSAPRDDPRAEREKVRAERARVASQIDTSKASLAEIDAALETIEANLRTQEAALARTEQEVAEAEKDIADAEAAIGRLTTEVGALRDEMRRRAVQAYVTPSGDDILTVLQTSDFTTAASRRFYIQLRAQNDAEVTDRLEGATTDLQFERKKATEARQRAEAKRAEQATRTQAVRDAEAAQQKLSDKLSAQVDSQVARSLELAATDRALSARIAQEQAALVARLAAQKAARDAAARRATRLPSTNQRPNGGESGPLPPVGAGGPVGGTSVPVCNAGGINVNCAIESRVVNMLNAARADGVALSGGGYRDSSQQIALRQAHCGSSYYAIYQMSAGSCRPPTARPGQSQHELGLAIDFSNCSRSSSCYRWLSANASRFGFYNLPSESWHWSTTGR
jgi:septal ring factor EnvC (AmiA/AmiB activator)